MRTVPKCGTVGLINSELTRSLTDSKMTSHEKFKNIADGIHNIVIVIALIVGGIWTLWTFSSLGERQKAQDERQKAQDELFKQAVLDIILDCKQEQLNNEDYIHANVKIVNHGKRNTFLDFSDSPCQVHKLVFNDDGSAETTFSISQDNLTSRSIVLRSGATQEYPFVIKVPEKGFYVVEYRVPLDSTEFTEHTRAGGPQGKIFWVGSATVMIK